MTAGILPPPSYRPTWNGTAPPTAIRNFAQETDDLFEEINIGTLLDPIYVGTPLVVNVHGADVEYVSGPPFPGGAFGNERTEVTNEGIVFEFTGRTIVLNGQSGA